MMTTNYRLGVLILGILLSGLQATSTPNSVGPSAIPTAVANFVQGYAASEASAMLPAASPLFWIELRRRGVTTPAQWADIRSSGLIFSPRGGTRDAHGFGHWFYTTRSARPEKKTPLTIWRIDSDLNDLVIWIEPVYFFSVCDDAVTDASRSTSRGQNEGKVATPPMTQFALRCAATREGYYVIQSRDGGTLSYSTVDADGETLPGAWSFGQIEERGEGSIALILRLNSLFKGPGDHEYLTYYRAVRR
jgi:hypothetical protein